MCIPHYYCCDHYYQVLNDTHHHIASCSVIEIVYYCYCLSCYCVYKPH